MRVSKMKHFGHNEFHFDSVSDGSSDLSCVSGDDEGFARPRVGHDFSGARVLEGGFLADLFSIVAFL